MCVNVFAWCLWIDWSLIKGVFSPPALKYWNPDQNGH